MASNPYKPPKVSVDPTGGRDVLLCPYCSYAIELTWWRYFTSRRFVCPRCGRKSKLGTGPSYWLLYLPVLVFGPPAISFFGLTILGIIYLPRDAEWLMLDTYAFVGVWGILYLLTLPIDRMVAVRYRRLLAIDEKSNAA